MGKNESPKEWQRGDLTDEELARIKQPIGNAPEPEAPIEVEPEPEIIIEGEAASAEEPPIVIDIDEEPQTVPSQSNQAEAAPSTPDRNEHDQMVKAILNLLRGVYRARHQGEEPDEKYVSRMRDMYANQSDEHLRQAVDVLMKESESLKKAA